MLVWGSLLAMALAVVLAVASHRWGGTHAQAALVTKSHVEVFELSPAGDLHLAGWAFSDDPGRKLELRINGRATAARWQKISRPDVAAKYPGIAAARTAGFDGHYSDPALARDGGLVTLQLAEGSGPPAIVAQRRLAPADAPTRWKSAIEERGSFPDDVFYFPIATSHVAAGGADGIHERFSASESATMKVGIRVQILYLRTTLGEAGDYAFDPAFRTDNKRCGKSPIAEDSLDEVIAYSVQHGMPVLFTLNGGIWADSLCDAPEWDINDRLEKDTALCQWNQRNEVMPDDYLSNKPGSFDSPQLARSLSLNIYAERPRFYKKRNLQQATKIIAQFAREHPDLFIGVNLDHDVYINPFFEGEQWYDYNPDTLRQFRQWLRGDGPYALKASGTDTDLTRYARAALLSLTDINRLAKAEWTDWKQVDPPRAFTKGSSAYREDPWFGLWEQFRRQLVAIHYDDLARWVAQAGIAPARIYTGQGFMAPGPNSDTLAEHIDSPAKNYDTGGVSIEGAKPLNGRLGAILYGASARNQIRMEGPHSLFAEFRSLSGENWAAVEFNTADLEQPKHLAGFGDAYQALRELGNYGARLVSPMAWNGSAADPFVPGFVSYTALRNTPLEDAMVQFMLQRANLPRSARLWEFGAPGHADEDGWFAPRKKASHEDRAGFFELTTDRDGVAAMESPSELDWKAGAFDRLVVAATADRPGLRVEVWAEAANDATWMPLAAATDFDKLHRTPAGASLPLDSVQAPGFEVPPRIDRIRLVWSAPPGTRIAVDRVALYPAVSH